MEGDTSVGKTLLLNRYVKGVLPKNVTPTVGVEYKLKEVTLKNKESIKANIWDTGTYFSLTSSGTREIQEYRQCVLILLYSSHYRKSMGALLVYDITDEHSFSNLSKWLEEIRNNS